MEAGLGGGGAVVTRLCIDRLRSARARREQYDGPWLPEPLPDERAPDAAEAVALENSLSVAFLVLLVPGSRRAAGGGGGLIGQGPG